MSGFDIFRKINAKLDEGWKLTNANCPICNVKSSLQLFIDSNRLPFLANPTQKIFIVLNVTCL